MNIILKNISKKLSPKNRNHLLKIYSETGYFKNSWFLGSFKMKYFLHIDYQIFINIKNKINDSQILLYKDNKKETLNC